MPDVDVAVDPLLVPQEQDTKSTTSTSGGRVMSKAAGQAIEDEYAANQAIAKARTAQGDAEALVTARKVDQLAIAQDLARAQAADAAAQHQDYLDRIAAARAAAAGAEEAFANHKFEDYWSRQGVGKRIAAAAPLFLGGVSASYLGGPNYAAEALNRTIDRDFQTQKLDLDQRRDVARMKGADVNELFVQEGHENAALSIKHAKAAEATAAAMIQAMTEAGVPLEQAKTNVAVKQLLGTAEEKRREALQHYDRTYSGSTTKTVKTGVPGAAKADDSLVYDSSGKPFKNAQTPVVANKFRSQQGALNDLGSAIDELDANYKEYGKENPFGLTEGSRERSAIMSRITLAAKTVGELGALSGPDMGIVQDIAGGRLGTILGNETGISNLKRLRENGLNNALSQIGAPPTPENRARFAAAPTDITERGSRGGTDVPPAGTPTAREPRPSRTVQSVPAGDLARMRKAHAKGIHDFDDTLRANGVIR